MNRNKNSYKYVKYTQSFNVWGDGLLDQKIVLKRWVFNWRFPFIHRIVNKYTVMEMQKLANKTLDQWINNHLSPTPKEK